jgi:peptidoglycan/xylan/chitin deacetylase (PgdA/CDA1 family)
MLTFRNVNRITGVLLIVFLLLKAVYFISFWWFIGLGIIWLTITIIGSFHIRWNYFLRAKHKNYQVKDEVISLTFDDGPNRDYTLKILKLLKQYNAKATFFLIGMNIEENSEILKDIIEQGHVIGNHTFSHSNNFGFLKTEEVISDLKKNTALVERLLNLKMNLFRPAFGVTNPRISRAVKFLQLQPVGWSVRSLDTAKSSEERVLQRIVKNLKNGDVILLHDTSQKSVEVLEQLLVFLEERNMKSVTIDQLFNIEAYA